MAEERQRKIGLIASRLLHSHIEMQIAKIVDEEHVVVDREDWEVVKDYLNKYPQVRKKLAENILERREKNSGAQKVLNLNILEDDNDSTIVDSEKVERDN